MAAKGDSRRKGKASELRCAAHFLMEDWDVSLPLIDTGADLVASKGTRSYRVQCRGRFVGQQFEEYEGWPGHPEPDLLYLDTGSDWWIVPRSVFIRVAGRPRIRSSRTDGTYKEYRVTQRQAREKFRRYQGVEGIRRAEGPRS